MSSSVWLKASGLYNSNNPLMSPEGSLQEASNVIVRREGILESRRGYKAMTFSELMDVSPEQILFYKNQLVRHVDNKLQHCDDENVVYDFVYPSTITSTDNRIKYIESNGNLLFTSDSGVKKISELETLSPTSEIFNAGVVQSITPSSEVLYKYGGLDGILPYDSACSYKAVWCTKDNNDVLVTGEPSASTTTFNTFYNIAYNDYNKLVYEASQMYSLPTSITDFSDVKFDELSVLETTSLNDYFTKINFLLEKLDRSYKYNQGANGFVLDNAKEFYYVQSDGTVILESISHIKWGDYFKQDDYIEITSSNSAITGFNINGMYKISNIDDTTDTASRKLYLAPHKNNYAIELSYTNKRAIGTDARFYSYNFAVLSEVIPASETFAKRYQIYEDLTNLLISIRVSLQKLTANYITANTAQRISLLTDTMYSEVDVTISIPDEIITSKNRHFIQIYRTKVVKNVTLSSSTSNLPSDTYYLVFEQYLPDSTLTSEYFSVNYAKNILKFKDNIPDSFLTTELYTNQTFEGPTQENGRPPICKDMFTYKGYTFFSNIKPKAFLELQVLGVDYLLSGGVPNLKITVGGITNEYKFRVGEKKRYTVNVATAAVSDYVIIKGDSQIFKFIFVLDDVLPFTYSPDYIQVPVYIKTGATSATKKAAFVSALESLVYDFSISDATTDDIQFVNNKEGIIGYTATSSVNIVLTQTEGAGENYLTKEFLVSTNISPAKSITFTCESLVRIINSDSSANVLAYYVAGPDDLPGTIFLRSKFVDEDITVSWGVPIGSDFSKVFNPTIDIDNTYTVYPENKKNLLFFSKFEQPEHVPLTNYFYIGSKDSEILRIIELRDSLFVFKRDGVWRISGAVAPFTIDLFDNTLRLTAPDSLVTINNFIMGFAINGIFMMSESSYKIVSYPIDTLIMPLFPKYKKNTKNTFDFVKNTYAIGYESDNCYLVFTYDVGGNIIGYRYSTLFDSWTTFDIQSTCGCINKSNDLMYLGTISNDILIERKEFDRTDYIDNEYAIPLLITDIEDSNKLFLGETLNSIINPVKGDVLVQEQEVTNSQFNDLLETLDDSSLLTYKNYSALNVVYANNIIDDIKALMLLLNTNDTGLDRVFPLNVFVYDDTKSITVNYNNMILTINTYLTYSLSDAIYTKLEVNIVDIVNNRIILEQGTTKLPIQLGPVIIYKGILCSVVYSPQTLGDPLNLKHFRETTLMLEHRRLSNITLKYSSDLMPVFTSFECELDKYRGFGDGSFGQGYFGGQGNMAPIRTYIPRNAQRGRYINIGFEIYGALQQLGVIGITLTGEVSSTRAYR